MKRIAILLGCLAAAALQSAVAAQAPAAAPEATAKPTAKFDRQQLESRLEQRGLRAKKMIDDARKSQTGSPSVAEPPRPR